MKRSSFITWDQLKVGALILVALVILGVAILRLGNAGNLFGKRYRLVGSVARPSGLRIGRPVTVAGQLAGSIKDIQFLPVDTDTTRNLKLIVEVNSALREQVRQDSRAKIKTMGLLGDKVFDITVGTPKYRALHEGETLVIAPSIDYEAVVQEASGAIGEVVRLTRDLSKVTSSINRGKGTLKKLFTDQQLYDQLVKTVTELNNVLVEVRRDPRRYTPGMIQVKLF